MPDTGHRRQEPVEGYRVGGPWCWCSTVSGVISVPPLCWRHGSSPHPEPELGSQIKPGEKRKLKYSSDKIDHIVCMSAPGHDDGCGPAQLTRCATVRSLLGRHHQCPHTTDTVTRKWPGGWGWCWADASPGTVRVTCTTHGPAPWHAGHFPTTRQQVHHLHHPCTTYSVLIYRVHAVFIVFYINHVSGIIQYLAQVMAKRLWWYVRCKTAGCWAELQTLSSCSIWTWAWRGTPSLRHPGTSQSWTLQNINK